MSRTTTVTGRGLGVLSAALGLPAVLAPQRVAEAVGLAPRGAPPAVVRAVGVRELAAACGLLAAPRPWQLWARVAGDGVDLSLLGAALSGRGARDRGRLAALTGLVTAVTVADVLAALAGSDDGRPVEVRAATTVAVDSREAYEAWRAFDRFPSFMAHVEDVTTSGPDGTRSHWVVRAPGGATVEWDASITEDRPGEVLAWRSEGGPVAHAGRVTFRAAPGGRGCEVHVQLRHTLPGGRVGRLVARWAGEEPRQQLDDDLRRWKQVVETGAVVVSDGAPWGKQARHEFPQRPAQPVEEVTA